MADYHPLIARAVEGLGTSSGEARRSLYERARAALVAQLRGIDPPLSEADITRERLALEDAMLLGKMLSDSVASYEQAFAQFVQQRRSRVERVIAEARRRGDGKRTLTPATAWIRDRVISAFALFSGARMNHWMYSYKID